MNQELGEIAWTIITGLHREVETLRPSSTLETTEAVRLAGLSYVMSSLSFGNFRFSKLSYEAERLGVTYDSISDLVHASLERYRGPQVSYLNCQDLVTLLGLIHSIGSYHLPLQYNLSTSQRPLGAYYTPQSVADYIVSLTLAPTLDRLAKSVRKDGVRALETLFSLRTLDPACGTGVFLISALKAYTEAIEKCIRLARDSRTSDKELEDAGVSNYIRRLRRNLYGVDIDAGALEVTDASLCLVTGSPNESLFGINLKQGNSLISLKGFNGRERHDHYFSDATSRQPFEWHDEFGEILKLGGFDFVIMNPPYERLKPNLAEFLRERILTGDREIHLEEYNTYKEHLTEDLQYYRKSGEYVVGNRYTIDVHRLFIERAIQLCRKEGSVGFIVPSTILGDLSSYPLRRTIIKENELKTVSDFPETSRLFEGVTQSVSVVSLKKGGTTTSFKAQFELTDIDSISDRSSIRIQTARIENAVGSYLSIPQLDRRGWPLLHKLHRQPSLSSADWLEVKRGELDLTLNKSCIVSSETEFRLIRGSDISRYLLLPRSNRSVEYVDINRLRESMVSSSRINHINKPRIACQQVSNRTQRWRLKFANIHSGAVLANSCNYIILEKGIPKNNLALLTGILNSEVMNWRFGLTNTNNHVSNRELLQLPIPNIEAISSEFLKSIVSEVRSIQKGNCGSHGHLEAMVFSLYGFSKREARIILEMRSTPEAEIREIIEKLQVM